MNIGRNNKAIGFLLSVLQKFKWNENILDTKCWLAGDLYYKKCSRKFFIFEKTIVDRNLESYERMKSARNSKYVGKYAFKLFSYIFIYKSTDCKN